MSLEHFGDMLATLFFVGFFLVIVGYGVFAFFAGIAAQAKKNKR